MKKIFQTMFITLMIVLSFNHICFAATIGRPTVSLKSSSRGSITVMSSNNKTVSGYEIKYGKTKTLKTCSIKKIKTKSALNNTIANLAPGKKYYFKVRAYRYISGKKHYSKWSYLKNCVAKSYNNGYVNVWRLGLCKDKSKGSEVVSYAKYMSPMKVYDSVGKYTSSRWVKVSYNGSIRYIYIICNDNPYPFTKTRSILTREKYYKYCSTDEEKAIINQAFYYYDNCIIHYRDSNGNRAVSDTEYYWDCSTFVANILRNCGYKITANCKDQYNERTEEDKRITINNVKPGDILFFDDDGRYDGIVDHSALYLGNGEFIESTKNLDGMVICPLTGKYAKRFMGARRIVNDY